MGGQAGSKLHEAVDGEEIRVEFDGTGVAAATFKRAGQDALETFTLTRGETQEWNPPSGGDVAPSTSVY